MSLYSGVTSFELGVIIWGEAHAHGPLRAHLLVVCTCHVISVRNNHRLLVLTLQGIVGNLSSGKSALVHRYLTGTYVQEESPEGKYIYFSQMCPVLHLWAKWRIILYSSCSLKLDKTCKIRQEISPAIQPTSASTNR